MDDEALISQIIYPIIFDKYPVGSITRVISLLKRDLSSDDLRKLSNLLKNGILDASHPVIRLHQPICEKKDLEIYLTALSEKI